MDRIQQQLNSEIVKIFLTVTDEEVYHEVLSLLLKTYESPYGFFGYINENNELIAPSLTHDVWEKCQVPDKSIVFPPEEWAGIWGDSLRDGKTYYKNSSLHVPEGHVPIHCVISVPIIFRNKTIGLLMIANKEGGYTQNEVNQVESIAEYIAPILQARLERDLYVRRESEQERKYQQLLELVREGIWVLDQDGYTTYANPHMASMLGYSGAAMQGKHLHEFLYDQDQSCEKFSFSACEQDNREANKEAFELDFIKTDGKRVSTSLITTPLFNERGELTGTIAAVRDITAQKELERSLIQEKERAEEANKLKSIFLASMSHEIRTPLNSVLGFLDIVLSDESIGEENTEYLVQAKKSGNILLQLITDIIDLSKIEADKIEIQESPLALQDVLVNIDSIARMLIKEKEKEITLRANVPAETDIILLGDQARIEQILINLISNAVKFTEEGYVEYGVSIGEDETVSFYVKDTGIGIPEEKKEIIFEAFRQAEEKTTKKYGGAGLGLAITSKLVERMGGSISFDSSSGKGTTFYVTLPLPEAKLEYEYVSSSSPSPAEPKKTKEKNTILIVEDNAINRKVISAMLQKAGYSVLLAENGEKAVEMIKTDPSIGLILMDMYMPHMDGIEATRTIRDSNQANNGADIPIIALTAAGMESDKQQMLEAGCNAFHPKPIDKQELLSQIHEYL